MKIKILVGLILSFMVENFVNIQGFLLIVSLLIIFYLVVKGDKDD